jgi:pimeloyl-ACP methyl ester carboxylesterase
MPLIHHVVAGSGGTPIVFVHGFACAHGDWDAQVAHLSPGRATVAVDLRGHGASPGDPADCSIERYGADVVEVMHALDLPPAIIVGHSLGCRVASEAALQAPSRTAGVILVDGSQFPPGADAGMRARFAAPEGFDGVANDLFVDMFTAKSDPSAAAAVVARARRLPPAIGMKMLLDLIRYDNARLKATYASLRVPVMAIQTTTRNADGRRGTLSQGQTTPYLDMLKGARPSPRIEIIEDTGHFPQIDEAARTNALMADFLSGF